MKLSLVLLTLLSIIVIIMAGCKSELTPASPSSASSTNAILPTKLTFITQPGGGVAGSALSAQPAVAIQDSNGNTVTGSILPVKLAITPGAGTPGVAVSGPSTINAVNGIAKFHDLSFDKSGVGYTLTATCGTLAPATSAPFSISPGKAAQLAFSIQPSGSTAGVPLPTQPEVTVQDHFGNAVTGYDGSVTMGITYGSGSSAGRLSGAAAVKVVNNVARFSNLSIDKAYPENYKLTASSDSLDSATSQGFIISPGPAAKLEFTIQPSGAKPGKAFTTQPKVAVEDSFGNVVTTSRASMTVSITPGTGTAAAILSGTKTRVAEDALGGLAEFTDLAISLPGSGYTLTATTTSLTPGISQVFNVVP
jgi:trimeric autotransporter adhesin